MLELRTKSYVEEQLNLLQKQVKEEQLEPVLAIIVADGYSPASSKYVKNKHTMASRVGVEVVEFPIKWEEVDPQHFKNQVKTMIDYLNKCYKINGIIVQLPIPYIDERELSQWILPEKDVDGFNPVNVGKLLLGHRDGFVSCTPLGISNYMDYMGIDVSSKKVCVIGRSNIVGKPMQAILTNKGATVIHCNSRTPDLAVETSSADIVISAIGQAKFFTKPYFNENSIIIDVGINFDNGKMCGDVDFEDVKDYVSAITPVPGGVGPLTVLSLMSNVIKAYRQQNGGI